MELIISLFLPHFLDYFRIPSLLFLYTDGLRIREANIFLEYYYVQSPNNLNSQLKGDSLRHACTGVTRTELGAFLCE